MQFTGRTQLHRAPRRGSHELAVIHEILDAAFLASVGFSIEGQPFVIPTLYGRKDDVLYIHGSAASRMLRELDKGVSACVTVTLVDGLVLARSAFHHSMNYRSVIAFGVARKVEESSEKTEALRIISEHLIRGRWCDVRGPSEKELKATTVLEFTMEEASAKARTGAPNDEEEDYTLPCWAGILPISLAAGGPISDPRLAAGITVPEYVSGYGRLSGEKPTTRE